MSDVDRLAVVLREKFQAAPHNGDFGWHCPPLDVIDCVLSLNRKYNSFVLPRVYGFQRNHPEITELPQLLALMDHHCSPGDFSVRELYYNHTERAQILRDVVRHLIKVQKNYDGKTELDKLHHWAISVKPADAYAMGIRGFGLAEFQYLRMLFGAQTTKPSIYINSFVSEVIGRSVDQETALYLLERAATRTGLPIQKVDGAIWK